MHIFISCETPEHLYSSIIEHIRRAEKARAQRLAVLSSAGVVASSVGIYFAGVWFYTDLTHTGFIQSFQLVFSDSSIVMTYWQDFASLLVEALPVMSLVACLAAGTAVLVCARTFQGSLKVVRARLA